MNSEQIRRLRNKFMLLSTISFMAVMFLMGFLIYTINISVTLRDIRSTLSYIAADEAADYASALPDTIPEDNSADNASDIRTQSDIPAERNDSEKNMHETASDETEFAETASDITESTEATSNKSESTEAISDESKSTEAMSDESEGAFSIINRQRLSMMDTFSMDMVTRNSPEFQYSTRYFAAAFSDDGECKWTDTSHIAAVESDENAEALARQLLNRKKHFGRYNTYYYLVTHINDLRVVVCMDCTQQIASNARIIYITAALIMIGAFLALLIMRILSMRFIRPEIENAQRQKQFITNASHELKTPLAVIRANTELEQMINGENEWNISTLKQVDHLTGLIANLVMITRAQEKENQPNRSETDAAKAVRETAETFRPLAEQKDKILDLSMIPETLMMYAAESQIRQLTSVLVDNAIKYCDDKGSIRVSLLQKGKQIRLEVSNSYAEGAKTDCSRFFDRFYRKDTSHNMDKGGYGIGLSIAESITASYSGNISASWKDGIITFTCIMKNIPEKIV